MNEKAKAARRAYMREYRRKNPDKFRSYSEKYWESLAERDEPKKEEGLELEAPIDIALESIALAKQKGAARVKFQIVRE